MPQATRTPARNRGRSRSQEDARPVRTAASPAPLPVTPRRRPLAYFLLALPGVLFLLGAALAIVLTPALAVLSLLGVLLAVANLHFSASARLLAELKARTLTAADEPQLFNVLEGLCIENGIEPPEVRLLDDAAANALLLPDGHGGAVLFCTRGLLDSLDRMALQGAVAAELASWKQGDLRAMQLLHRATGAYAVLSPGAASLVWRLTDPTRQFRGDRAACRMTRFPPGLHAALSVLDAGATTPRQLSPLVVRLTAPYWLAPLALGAPKTPRPGELDLGLRISALAEL